MPSDEDVHAYLARLKTAIAPGDLVYRGVPMSEFSRDELLKMAALSQDRRNQELVAAGADLKGGFSGND